MSSRSPGLQSGSKCNFILQGCLAVQLQKIGTAVPHVSRSLYRGSTRRNVEGGEYWMYDNGYLLFQGFIEANSKCFWNVSLLEAMKELEFEGYVAQGILLVSGTACALEVLRSAWSRNVLKAPTNYTIILVGDIEDCLITHINQGQFTPLPEALCWVILELTSSGQHAVLNNIRSCLHLSFPDIEKPSAQVVYDTLAKLMTDKKIYQTSQGYFIVTPETRRLRPQKPNEASPQVKRSHRRSASDSRGDSRTKSLLMTNEEALTYVHGEMTTIRDGDVTHQSIQTNLADVICGGNPNDKILYASVPKRSTSFPLERRNSLKLFGSNKKLSSTLTRSGSMKFISNKNGSSVADSSSCTEYPIVANLSPSPTKKLSLLSRIFRRSGRKRGASAPPTIHTFSAQFPPAEWFNPKVIHMHSIGTQTKGQESSSQNTLLQWDAESSSRSCTLPRSSKSQDLDQSHIIYQSPKNEIKYLSPTDSFRRRESHRTPLRSSNYSRIESPNQRSVRSALNVSERSQTEEQNDNKSPFPGASRCTVSKSLKSLHRNELCISEMEAKSDSRLYEEIPNRNITSLPKLNDSATIYSENIYSRIQDRNTKAQDEASNVYENISSLKLKQKNLSNPSTPKISRRVEKRSSSLPRRKLSTVTCNKTETQQPVTHTDFPYIESVDSKQETWTTRRSNSYENVNFDENLISTIGSSSTLIKPEKTSVVAKKQDLEDHVQDLTSLTSSGYDTQANSIISTCEQLPYSLKINENFINSSTPPSSLQVLNDSLFNDKCSSVLTSSGHSSRSISPCRSRLSISPSIVSHRSTDDVKKHLLSDAKATVNVSSNISVSTGCRENKFSLQVSTSANSSPRNDTRNYKKIFERADKKDKKSEVIVSSETDQLGAPITTTTTTINRSGTKIFVQQKNTPVRSLITVENGTNDQNVVLKSTNDSSRPKLERLVSLYSPREVLKTGHGFEKINVQQFIDDDDSDLDNPKWNQNNEEVFSEFDIDNIPKNHESTNEDVDKDNLKNVLNNSNISSQSMNDNTKLNISCLTDKYPSFGNIDAEKDDYGLSHKPIPRYFNIELSKLQDLSSTLIKSSGLNSLKNLRQYKNDINNDEITVKDEKQGELLKNNNGRNRIDYLRNDRKYSDFHQNEINKLKKVTPTRIPVKRNRAKQLNRPLSIDNSQLMPNKQNNSHDHTEPCRTEHVEDDIPTFPSLSDLTVNFKSLAAQNILHNVSLNSVDTLVELNMAAAAASGSDPNEELSCSSLNVHSDLSIV